MTHHMQARARAVVHVRACIPSLVHPYHLERQNVLIRTINVHTAQSKTAWHEARIFWPGTSTARPDGVWARASMARSSRSCLGPC